MNILRNLPEGCLPTNIFCKSQTTETQQRKFIRVAGNQPTLIPAASIVRVKCTGIPSSKTVLIEPVKQLPVQLNVAPTLSCGSVEVLNVSEKDVWLLPNTRLGLPQEYELVEKVSLSVEVNRIHVDCMSDSTVNNIKVPDLSDFRGTTEESQKAKRSIS